MVVVLERDRGAGEADVEIFSLCGPGELLNELDRFFRGAIFFVFIFARFAVVVLNF